MKKHLFLMLLLVFYSCNKNEPDETPHPDGEFIEEEYFKTKNTFTIIDGKGACGDLRYRDRIGNDFEMAFDSVVVFMNEIRANRIYLPNTLIDTITVDFDFDDRDFMRIKFFDERNEFLVGTFLDSNGNNYYDLGCEG